MNGDENFLATWGWELLIGVLLLIVLPLMKWIGKTGWNKIQKLEDKIPDLATREEVDECRISLENKIDASRVQLEDRLDKILTEVLRR